MLLLFGLGFAGLRRVGSLEGRRQRSSTLKIASRLTDLTNCMAEQNTPLESLLSFRSSLLRLANLSQDAQPDKKELAKPAEALEALTRKVASTLPRAQV